MQNKLEILINRLRKLNIDIEFWGNYPWIYIHSINKKIVKETFHANHGFTVIYQPIDKNQFIDIKELFKLIKKYK